ncbi:hypothetical protein [Dactylosporangium sp. NPDC049140]|uniref:hypothetical protein n=1 Tax=Dactylosporangium sp. NPDC049140 TaxID=3155647 RepID=UPI0033C3E193
MSHPQQPPADREPHEEQRGRHSAEPPPEQLGFYRGAAGRAQVPAQPQIPAQPAQYAADPAQAQAAAAYAAQLQAAQAAQAQAQAYAQAQAEAAAHAQAQAAYAAQAQAQAQAQQAQAAQARAAVVPQQARPTGREHVTTEVRPAAAPPQFDLETSLSRSAAPSLPWQQAQAAAAAPGTAQRHAAGPVQARPEDLAIRQEGPTGPPPRAQAAPRRLGKPLAPSLPRLHVGWHDVNGAALKQMRGGTGATGLMLGVDYQRQPVPIRLFRAESTRVTLVGGLWAQRLLVFRTLALGARVIVMTGDPRPWQGLGEWATGLNDRLVLWNDPRPPAAPASARQPLLIVTDVSQVGFGARPELGPWQTQVTVVRKLGAEHAHTLQGCNLVMLQKLNRQEAAVAGSALNLTESGTGLLQEMTPEMLALMGSGANRYVWLSPTSVEQQYHGPPQR